MWALSTCGEPDDIKKTTHPTNGTALCRGQVPAAAECGKATEGGSDTLGLACTGGGTIASIDFAAWGTPSVSGACSTWAANATCNDNAALVKAFVAKACLGKATCTLAFGGSGHSALGDPCPSVDKTLAVKATCTAGKTYTPAAAATVSVGGALVWDGRQLVGSHPGITAGADVGDGVQFAVTNGAFAFEAKAVATGPAQLEAHTSL